MADYESVLSTPELGPGHMREVHAHGEPIVLVNVAQRYFALQANCPHDATNLATDGKLSGDHLVCPHDNWTYDVRTGERIEHPGDPPLERYDVKIEGNEILIGPPLGPDGKS